MLSQPNIYRFELKRLRFDSNDLIRLPFARDGVAENLTSRSFLFRFCAAGTATKVLDVPLAGNSTGVISFNPVDYLPDLPAKTYTCLLFEVLAVGQNDLLAWAEFFWLDLPEPVVPGQPRQPADVLIDTRTVTANTVAVPVFALPVGLPAYTSETQAIAAPIAVGAAMLVRVGDDLYLKTAAGIRLVPLNELIN